MMNYSAYGSMMGGSFGGIMWFVILADLVLLGVWLLKQLVKK